MLSSEKGNPIRRGRDEEYNELMKELLVTAQAKQRSYRDGKIERKSGFVR
jgi:hypothetical protein